MKLSPYLLLIAFTGATGCATQAAPITDGAIIASDTANLPPALGEQLPQTASRPAVASSVTQRPASSAFTAPPPVMIREPGGRELLDKLLPANIADRNGWATDIFNAFVALQIPQTPEYFCASMAVIEQESSWQADPVVPGLGKAVWKELDRRASKYHIPLFTVQAALMVPSLEGRSYKARIDALQTEKQMNDLFEAIVNESPDIAHKLGITNPIRTGGPMQVSVDFATAQTRAWSYPYPIKNNIRSEVFTRRGGVYFGTAHLLQYRAPYKDMLYRFADFNAGRYSSRNAAFQQAVAKLAKTRIVPDGDLLIYQDGRPVNEHSSTEKALFKIAAPLGLATQDIASDLAKEKTLAFDQTALYQRVFALADKSSGHALPREVLPQIRLQSAKITRKLTTAWFAERVNGRYLQCLTRK
ncbi:MAG: DUF1615 domain-containing protein [Formivibrio sp.]|nr:DUF1615 domain-containing protein [Formivibrio sp.]